MIDGLAMGISGDESQPLGGALIRQITLRIGSAINDHAEIWRPTAKYCDEEKWFVVGWLGPTRLALDRVIMGAVDWVG
jgi:hypothetical protein